LLSVERLITGRPSASWPGGNKGSLGYYDDDLGSDRRPGRAIVYLGEPFVSDYILVRRADLQKVTATHLGLERWKRSTRGSPGG
jgi:hypothetical protein